VSATATIHPRFFTVTSPGLSATRWLSYAIASHPDVFVAHGKHALNAIHEGDFDVEKAVAHEESLTRGNDLLDLYLREPLEKVLQLYRKTKPEARAFGCVHSYTMDSLVRAARKPYTLDRICVWNLLRHPVNFIASHVSLVRSAEQHPPLYRQYVERVFAQALEAVPELFLIDCPDYREFLTFTVSCFGVANLVCDFVYPEVRHVKMEELTTRLDLLQSVCEDLTGLTYAKESLERFVRGGAINAHRSSGGERDPHAIVAGWAQWQQDIARVMIPEVVCSFLEEKGYDLSMLREMPPPVGDAKASLSPCLGDCMTALDPDHPLLRYKTQYRTSSLQTLLEEQFKLVRHQGRVYGVPRSLGITDFTHLSATERRQYEKQGRCVSAKSLGGLWKAIFHRLNPRPVARVNWRYTVGQWFPPQLLRFLLRVSGRGPKPLPPTEP